LAGNIGNLQSPQSPIRRHKYNHIRCCPTLVAQLKQLTFPAQIMTKKSMIPSHNATEIEPFQAVIAAPGFALGLRCTADEISAIEFLAPCAEIAATTLLAQEAARQLRCYLRDSTFAFTLPLAPAGTPFQRSVWAQISEIPYGKTRTYGALALALHSAPRAVGGACGANPYPLVIPCHRVVASNSGLGGFNREHGGLLLDIKRWLLAHEGVRGIRDTP
jgi:methylated-DNA-[protein]-cysteine S-methyltransferase